MVISQSLIDRYRELKKEAEDAVLLMQVGAFMQVMDSDARTLSGLNGLKLKMGGDVDDPVVIGGFPKTGLDKSVGILARAGKSVAIAFQDETKQRTITEIVRVQST